MGSTCSVTAGGRGESQLARKVAGAPLQLVVVDRASEVESNGEALFRPALTMSSHSSSGAGNEIHKGRLVKTLV